MSTPQQQALRGVGCARVLVGVFTLVATGRDDVPVFDELPPRAALAARVLGVRDLVQGAALAAAPGRRAAEVVRLCSALDGLHAASMLPLAAFSSRYRVGATLSAASALAWIALTSIASRGCSGAAGSSGSPTR
jgi:hypothetical protein